MPAKTLHFQSPRHLSQLYAGREENLAHAERALGVKLVTREDWLKIEAPLEPLALAEEFFAFLNAARSQGMTIRTPDFARLVDSFAKGEAGQWQAFLDEPLVLATNRKSVVPKTIGQREYLQSVLKKPIVIGIGPAGTGKTYLAIAAAVSALLNHEVNRIVLTRPAVEAGEALGFLPGDLREKILPYLRPLYDALHDMLDPEEVVARGRPARLGHCSGTSERPRNRTHDPFGAELNPLAARRRVGPGHKQLDRRGSRGGCAGTPGTFGSRLHSATTHRISIPELFLCAHPRALARPRHVRCRHVADADRGGLAGTEAAAVALGHSARLAPRPRCRTARPPVHPPDADASSLTGAPPAQSAASFRSASINAVRPARAANERRLRRRCIPTIST